MLGKIPFLPLLFTITIVIVIRSIADTLNELKKRKGKGTKGLN